MFNSQLTAFVCVADCGSFNKAAEKMFISSTAIMKQVNALENHLSLKLFERDNQGVKLTAAGESIYKDAKYMMDYSHKAIKNAHQIADVENYTICVGTSMLNPCKVFMDLWYDISDSYPQYKIHIVPFEDSHDGILTEVDKLGEKYDFLVAACDSEEWLKRCSFQPLGEYRRRLAVPTKHRLATKKTLKMVDLYGETLMMVKQGDSPQNDRIREEIERNHPQIKIEDTPMFYDIDVFNRCMETNSILSTLECWKDIHPGLVTIPTDWENTIPYGLLYALNPPKDILAFVNVIKESRMF